MWTALPSLEEEGLALAEGIGELTGRCGRPLLATTIHLSVRKLDHIGTSILHIHSYIHTNTPKFIHILRQSPTGHEPIHVCMYEYMCACLYVCMSVCSVCLSVNVCMLCMCGEFCDVFLRGVFLDVTPQG